MSSCRVWSLDASKAWQGLCSQELKPETSNPTTDCGVCVTPIFVDGSSSSSGFTSSGPSEP